MSFVKLTSVASLKSDRVTNFSGIKQYVATGDIDDFGNIIEKFTSYEDRPSRADLLVNINDVLLIPY